MPGNVTLPGLQAEPVSGRVKWTFVDHYGPASYVNPGGDPFPTQNQYGGPNSAGLSSVFTVVPAFTQDGTYRVQLSIPSQGNVVGGAKLLWFVVATGAQVANGTNLSAEMVRLEIKGG